MSGPKVALKQISFSNTDRIRDFIDNNRNLAVFLSIVLNISRQMGKRA
jgi:hypothetical protein